jgi:glutamyl-tRNA synthetase
MPSPVRTRFAPSPTGYLHIGGVRTALFCWLFARQRGGAFILRIDDTDQKRNVDAALAPILRGFRWLGIDWDEGPDVGGPHAPYFQSQRQELYRAAVDRLLERGFAYRDYATEDDVQAEFDAAKSAKRPFVYSRRWMAVTDADRARFEAAGRSWTIRLKMPREGGVVVRDLVRGEVPFEWSNEGDKVVQRSDGGCGYDLATVVDDHAFGITHVIRSEEHLSNTPRQMFIAAGLGYASPEFAHLPYVAEPGGRKKLSKRELERYLANRDFASLNRHGQAIAAALGVASTAATFNPVIVDFYEQIGYLPDAVLNALLLLGWSLDDRTEHFTRAEMLEHFSLERVKKGPGSFDAKKLASFQEHAMRSLTLDQRLAGVRPFLARAGLLPDPAPADDEARLRRVIAAVGDRLKVFGDVIEQAGFFFVDDVAYDTEAFDKRLRKPGALPLLARFRDRLATAEVFEPPPLEQLMADFLASEGVAIGEIVHALRVAVTGRGVGPGIYDCLAILGREACVRRIDRALALARG